MPGMDGYQLANKIIDEYPDIKIQLMSGFTGERKSSYFDEGLHGRLILKPFTVKTLLKSIDLLVNESPENV